MRFPFLPILAFAAGLALETAGADAAPASDVARAFVPQHGSWKTHVRRLRKPLSGGTEWLEYEGTTVVHPLLDGRANVAELSIAGPAGRIDGAALRLYEPATARWTIHYFNAAEGRLTSPLTGTFHDGRGIFSGEDTLGDRPIQVRFVIIPVAPDRFRFEQSFSGDGGRSWELNWIAEDRR